MDGRVYLAASDVQKCWWWFFEACTKAGPADVLSEIPWAYGSTTKPFHCGFGRFGGQGFFTLIRNTSGQGLPFLNTINQTIKQVSQAKSLGVYVDENLSWSTHINEITKKIASCIGALKSVRPFVPVNTLMTIFNSSVQPHFNYCCEIWNSCSKTLAAKLQKLQNRAARVSTFSVYDASADPLIEILGWQKLKLQRSFHKAVMVYKSLNGLDPEYMRSMFIHRGTVYSLRDAEGKVNIPKPRTNYLENSFSYASAVLWNSLAAGLRQGEILESFKTRLW